jgi:hypothetical protein
MTTITICNLPRLDHLARAAMLSTQGGYAFAKAYPSVPLTGWAPQPLRPSIKDDQATSYWPPVPILPSEEALA